MGDRHAGHLTRAACEQARHHFRRASLKLKGFRLFNRRTLLRQAIAETSAAAMHPEQALLPTQAQQEEQLVHKRQVMAAKPSFRKFLKESADSRVRALVSRSSYA